jgi:FAD/FMN-containing dehydrogenase
MLEIQSIDNAAVSINDDSLQQLRAAVMGDVLTAAESGYDDARGIFNAMIDKRPALIALCTGTADVIACVRFARDHRLLTSIRGGGHGIAGNAVCDGGFMIHLGAMNAVRVDPAQKIAWVQGGATLADLDHETAAFDLACPVGVVSRTGVAGLTTGGGYGWLRSEHGMSVDNLRAVEMVTADGEYRRVSKDENADLFWGIRGGGGNFGVVTTFEFDAHQLPPEVMLCNPVYAAEHAQTVLRGWREFMGDAPDQFTSEFFFWTIPAVEGWPEEMHGMDVVVPCGVYNGPLDEAEKFIQPLRELALPYGEVMGYWKALYMDRMDDAIVDTFVKHFMDRPEGAKLCPLVLHYLGGASQRIAPESTAFPGRGWKYLMEYNLTWNDPAKDVACTEWVRNAWNEVREEHGQHAGTYLNIDSYNEDGLEYVQETYRENYARLQQIKKKYDPENLFRLNGNIEPAA